jgi:hypothetical protein
VAQVRRIMYDPNMAEPTSTVEENSRGETAAAASSGEDQDAAATRGQDAAAARGDRDSAAGTPPPGKQGKAANRAPLSPRELQRIKTKHQLWLAILLTFIFVVIVVWASLPRQDAGEPLGITSAVRFDDRCIRVAAENKDILHVTEFEVSDAMMARVKHLDSVETLIIDKGVLSDRAINPISAMPRLRHLRLRLSPITDEGLKTLAQCESLWYINLPHARCTAEGVAALRQIPRLRQLRLGSPGLGNEVTAAIASIESLRGIHLIGVAVTDEGLKTLAAMPHLESLYLDDAKVTEAGWEWLFRNYPQIHVHVNQEHHDHDPKRHAHHD